MKKLLSATRILFVLIMAFATMNCAGLMLADKNATVDLVLERIDMEPLVIKIPAECKEIIQINEKSGISLIQPLLPDIYAMQFEGETFLYTFLFEGFTYHTISKFNKDTGELKEWLNLDGKLVSVSEEKALKFLEDFFEEKEKEYSNPKLGI